MEHTQLCHDLVYNMLHSADLVLHVFSNRFGVQMKENEQVNSTERKYELYRSMQHSKFDTFRRIYESCFVFLPLSSFQLLYLKKTKSVE